MTADANLDFLNLRSVRPTLDQILVNIDTSITAMYQSGPVIDVALAFLGERDVRALALRENDVRFHELERFLKGLLIYVDHLGRRTKVIRGLVYKGGSYQFDKDGRTLTVAVRIVTLISHHDPNTTLLRNTSGLHIVSRRDSPTLLASYCPERTLRAQMSSQWNFAKFSQANCTRRSYQIISLARWYRLRLSRRVIDYEPSKHRETVGVWRHPWVFA